MSAVVPANERETVGGVLDLNSGDGIGAARVVDKGETDDLAGLAGLDSGPAERVSAAKGASSGLCAFNGGNNGAGDEGVVVGVGGCTCFSHFLGRTVVEFDSNVGHALLDNKSDETSIYWFEVEGSDGIDCVVAE